MINRNAWLLGSNRSCIRELFEYGNARAAMVGRENVFDYSLGNPSIPAPKEVDRTIREILEDTDSLAIHGYTSAIGDLAARTAIAGDLNRRYNAQADPADFFIAGGAAPELVAVFRALAVPGAEILALAPYFPEYKPFVESAGITFKVVPPTPPTFQINLKKLEAMVTPTPRPSLSTPPTIPPVSSMPKPIWKGWRRSCGRRAGNTAIPSTSSPTSLTGNWPTAA